VPFGRLRLAGISSTPRRPASARAGLAHSFQCFFHQGRSSGRSAPYAGPSCAGCRRVTAVAILTELAGRLRGKFGWDAAPITRAVKAISRVAEVVKTVPYLEIAHDPTDNRILECAEKGAADLIVTGDRHLLKLRRFGRTGIVKVSTFLHTVG